MYLTRETIEKYNNKHDKEYVDWLIYHFPQGGEVSEILTHSDISYDILHWLNLHFSLNEEEQKIYFDKLNINCDIPNTIYESDNIKNSNWVSRSSYIENSEYIFSSQNITSSDNVLLSEDVVNSSQIFGSEFIYSSKQILYSKNITKSNNIVGSDYVVNSHSVMNSAAVTDSAYVNAWSSGGSKQIKDCRFIMECTNLKKSLFCFRVHNDSYMMFNQKIEEADYINIVEQLDNILGRYKTELVIEGEWPFGTIPLNTPKIQRNVIKQYNLLPSVFWRWVKTLPGYDPSVLYAITYNKELI